MEDAKLKEGAQVEHVNYLDPLWCLGLARSKPQYPYPRPKPSTWQAGVVALKLCG